MKLVTKLILMKLVTMKLVTKFVSIKLVTKLVSRINYKDFSHFLLFDSKLVTNFIILETNKLVSKNNFFLMYSLRRR